MINILFMIEDNTYRKNLINSLILKNENFRVAYISTELKDFNYVISNYKIDIILVNVNELICKKILHNEILNKKKYKNTKFKKREILIDKTKLIKLTDKFKVTKAAAKARALVPPAKRLKKFTIVLVFI